MFASILKFYRNSFLNLGNDFIIKKSERKTNNNIWHQNLFKKNTPTQKEIITWTKQLSLLIKVGITISEALKIAEAQQKPSSAIYKLTTQIRAAIDNGTTFSSALKKYQKEFNHIYIAMIEVGESSGTLDICFQQLTTLLEKNYQIRKQIINATIYPICVISVAIIVITLLLTSVIPAFTAIYSEMQAELPAITNFVISTSEFLIHNFILLVSIICTGIYFAFQQFNNANSRMSIDKAIYKVPLLGHIILKLDTARFASAISTLLNTGCPIITALEISSKTVSNSFFTKNIKEISNKIAAGESLTLACEDITLFPILVKQLLNVGETTGAIDDMFNNVSTNYEIECENFIKNLKQILEPAIIIILGLVVGTIVVAMYLPILQMGQLI